MGYVAHFRKPRMKPCAGHASLGARGLLLAKTGIAALVDLGFALQRFQPHRLTIKLSFDPREGD